ncbi:MAG: FHA domain-containing protein, partial [Anaerolineales bacterium]
AELRPGVQVVFAINPGDSFTIRNSQGLSRYDFIYNALNNWADARQGSTVDDLSLIVTTGPVRSHTVDPAEMLSALDSFQIDSASANPSLDTLSQALDVALDPTPRVGMERAILFITSPMAGDMESGVQDLVTRARQQQVRIYIWFIGSPELLETPASKQLQELAAQTNGAFLSFADIDQLPSPETFLGRLRDIYLLTYETSSSTGGVRRLKAEIQNGDEQIVTPELEYELILIPPDPAFISPVAEIARQVPEQGSVEFWEQAGAADLLPKEHPLQVLVDFPDGRTRPLVLTRLYVDGQVVAENTAPPFDWFTWDLTAYTTSGRHILQVEAVDSLGLTGTSIETPVQVTVALPGASPLVMLIRKAPLAIGLVIVLSAALSLLVLIVGGKIKPRPLRVPAGFRYNRKKQADRKASQTPQEQQAVLQAEMDGRRFSGWVSRLHWPQRRLAQQAYAYLIPIAEADSGVPETPITIDSNEITLGSDRNQAVLVFDDLSVEALHARLTRFDDEKFVLADQGSVSGTWLNYSPVTREGLPVQHGDIIHIGRVGFQFKLRKPRHTRKPVVVRIDSSN